MMIRKLFKNIANFAILLAMSLTLLACAEQQASSQGSRESFSAPLPASLVAALSDIDGSLLIFAVIDRGTAQEKRYQLEDVIINENGTFSGKFNPNLGSGQHTIELEFLIQHSGYPEAILIAVTDAETSSLVAGKNNVLDFSDNAIDDSIDADGDRVPDLIELQLGFDARSVDSFPVFSLASSVPEQDATSVALDSPIELIFSEPVDASTVTANSVVLKTGGQPVSGALSTNESSVSFTPAEAFIPDTVYSVVISSDVMSATGVGFSGTQWDFTTSIFDSAGNKHLTRDKVPYADFVDAGGSQKYIVSGLVAGGLHSVSLRDIDENVNLAVYKDDTFTQPICVSENPGIAAESCAISADAVGKVYMLVDGLPASQRASFSLDLVDMSDITGGLPFTGELVLGGKVNYLVSGLNPGERLLVEVMQTIPAYDDVSKTGNFDLFVYSDPFNTESCRSARGDEWLDPIANEGCIATVNADGEIYISVQGTGYWDGNSDGPMSFTLSLAAPATADLPATNLPFETSGGVPSALNYYRITGLTPESRYVVRFSDWILGSRKVSRYIYTQDNFDHNSRADCDPYEYECSGSTDTEGNLFVVIDGRFEGNARDYRISVYPWTEVAGEVPVSVTTNGDPGYLVVRGLDLNTVYSAMIANDDPESYQDGDIGWSLYNSDTMRDKACSNSQISLCGSNDMPSDAGVPNEAGEIYIPVSTKPGNLSFILTKEIGRDFPLSSTIAANSRQYVISSAYGRLVWQLGNMSDDVDLAVFTRSLVTPDCTSSRSVDGNGNPLADYCGWHETAGKHLLLIDSAKATTVTSFDVFVQGIGFKRYFGQVSDGGVPIDVFPQTETMPADEVVRFFDVWSMDANTEYTFSLDNVSAADAVEISVYSGPVEADGHVCIADVTTSCTAMSDAEGDMRIKISKPANIEAQYTIHIDTPPPVTTNLVGSTAVLGDLASHASAYYKFSGLTPDQVYDVLVDVGTNENFDLYVYDDASFNKQNRICYSLAGRSQGESCSVPATTAGELYIRVYNNEFSTYGFTLSVQ